MDTVTWRKSTYSGGQGSDCIEVASNPRTIAVRDTKQEGQRDRVTLTVSASVWRRFIDEVK